MGELDAIAERVDRFRRAAPDFEMIRAELERRLAAAVADRQGEISLLSSRVKSELSVSTKLSRPDRTYASLWDLTDLVGLRLVSLFESSIPDLAGAVERAFDVDLARSRDRLSTDDHERFGYRALHFVCRVPRDLLAKAPALPAADVRFEVQIRSALQNVWAELEHGLGYKASDLASPALRRRFSRISSLLEIADEELDGVREELRARIADRSDGAPLDAVEASRLAESEEVGQADRAIAARYGLPLDERAFFPDYLAKALMLSGLKTAADALASLRKLGPLLDEFVPAYFRFADARWGLRPSAMSSIGRGYSLLFIAHLQVLDAEPLAVRRADALGRFYLRLDSDQTPLSAREAAVALLEAIDRTP